MKLLQDAKKCPELMWQMEVNRDQEIIDGLKPREIEEYPDAEILSEAEHVLSTYYEIGWGAHNRGIVLSGEEVKHAKRRASEAVWRGPSALKQATAALKQAIEERKEARAEVRRLKNIVKKYKKELAL